MDGVPSTFLFGYQVSAVVFFMILLLAVVLFVKSRRQPKLSAPHRQQIQRLWKQIQKETDGRQQLLHADSLLDKTLGYSGYSEKGLGNKLKTNPTLFHDMNDVWWAHKLRNRIAHEITFTPNSSTTRRAMSTFRAALNELGAEL